MRRTVAGVARLRQGCGLVVATSGAMGVTVVGFGEALSVGGRAWWAVALGVAIFVACLVLISRNARRRR